MERPRICAVLVKSDPAIAVSVEPAVDLYEVRIDLVGEGWPELAKALNKPWIATNRRSAEGGNWHGSETQRIEQLLRAVLLGAATVDIELRTNGLADVVKSIAKRAQLLISYHDFSSTPSIEEMSQIVHRQLEAGADICKVVTTARSQADNLAVLQLVSEFAENRVVSFAMGHLGQVSRVLCPLVGGDFTYASIAEGMESASGQMTAQELRRIYGMLKNG